VLAFELVFRLWLGLGLVMTVQILTVQIKTGNHSSLPHFLAHVYCGQTAGWIKIPFGMEVRLGPDHIVLDGNPAPHKGYSSPLICGRCLLWLNNWMDQSATWYGGRPQRRRHCVRWHVQIGKRFESSIVLWAFHKIQPSSSSFLFSSFVVHFSFGSLR